MKQIKVYTVNFYISAGLTKLQLDDKVRLLLDGGHVLVGTVGESDEPSAYLVLHSDKVAYIVPHDSVVTYGLIFEG